MSPEENKALVCQYVDSIDNKDLDAAFMALGSDFVEHAIHSPMRTSFQVIRQFFQYQFAAFPDMHATIEDLIAEDDRVVTRITVRGTNTGPFMGMPPTGKSATWSFIDIFRIADGRIAEHWVEMDSIALMQQLGLVPPPTH